MEKKINKQRHLLPSQKRRNALIALKTVFPVASCLMCEAQGRCPTNRTYHLSGCHLFLETFDDQIFTVLSLDAVKMCLELVHMAFIGLS